MNYTKEQILDKAKKIMSDLNADNFNEENIDKIWFEEKDEVARPKGIKINTWTISIIEPIFEGSDFLIISDETGEPLYLQNVNMIIHEIKKDSIGNYY